MWQHTPAILALVGGGESLEAQQHPTGPVGGQPGTHRSCPKPSQTNRWQKRNGLCIKKSNSSINQPTNQPTVYKNKNREITIQPMEEKKPKKRFIQVVTFVNTTKGLVTFYLSRSWSIENCFLLFVWVCVWEREETDRDRKIHRERSKWSDVLTYTDTYTKMAYTHTCMHTP